MLGFEFATATRVLFGSGKVAEAPGLLRDLGGKRVLLVTGKNPARAEPLRERLASAGLDVVTFAVPGEPTVELACAGAAHAIHERCNAVVAFGGGSALDAGKAIAALATNPGDPLDYLEVIGRALPLRHAPLPFLAIATTAGTGSEVTRNAVLLSRSARVKVSLRSPLMLPTAAIIDPELLIGAPPAVLVSSGVDALSQLIEPFLSPKANPLTDSLAREGIRRSVRALRPAVLDGATNDRREDLAVASLFGGLCLANAGLGAVHGFAAPAGGMFEAPHGAVCAALLAPVVAVNARALRERAPSHPSLARLEELGVLVTGNGHAGADDAITWLEHLRRDLAVPGLHRYGMNARDIPALVEKAKVASSMKGNPLVLTDQELTDIATQALADAS
ncbi:MAG TPA: iron-containing alcohol dehydrogenase [Polyangia bacterium]